MNAGKSATPSSWNVDRVRSGLLNNLSSGQDTRPQLQAFLELEAHIQVIRQLTAGEQTKLLEIIDQATSTELARDTKFVAALGDISSDAGLLPNSVGSLQGFEKRGEIAVATGGTTDIWRGVLNGKQVAIKAFRTYRPDDLQEAKTILWKLVPIWKRMTHENVLPFRGVDMSAFQLALVYDWGHNGNIMQYLESHPDASRPRLLLQIAKGLQYLHSLDIVHGNLKGANVVISKAGAAQVCDYGLSPIISTQILTIAATPGVAGSSRWLAPEITDPPRRASSKPITASKPADIFAFAMLAVEVFSGKAPFGDMRNESVIIQIASGKRPAKLQVTAEMWESIEKCWNANPSERPTIDEVVSAWEGFVNRNIVSSLGPPTSRHITIRDSSRNSTSKASGRHSQSAERSTIHTEKPGLSPPRKWFLC